MHLFLARTLPSQKVNAFIFGELAALNPPSLLHGPPAYVGLHFIGAFELRTRSCVSSTANHGIIAVETLPSSLTPITIL